MNTKLRYIEDWCDLARQANWSVTRMAQLCGVSIRTLELYSLKEWGKTPKAWLVEQRQEQAVGLLSTGASVKETAARLGYKHAHHFSREFKKIQGFSPKQSAIRMIRVRLLS